MTSIEPNRCASAAPTVGRRVRGVLAAIALWAILLHPAAAPAAAAQTPAGRVAGSVRTGHGTPLEGQRVAVTPVPLPGESAGSILQSIGATDAAGRYLLEDVPPGAYHVVVGPVDSLLYHPGTPESASATVITVAAGVTTEVSDLILARTRVRGRVVDAGTGEGRFIESLSLCCRYSQPAAADLIRTPVGLDGTFEFPDVLPGNYYFAAEAPDIVSIAEPLAVGDADLEVDLKVFGGAAVRGVAVDRAGLPLTGGTVWLRPGGAGAVFDITGSSTLYAPVNFLRALLLDGVRGRVTGGSSPTPATPAMEEIVEHLTLRSADVVRTAEIQQDGSFSFTRIPPGVFRLETIDGCTAAAQEIQVGIDGLDGIRVESPDLLFYGRVVMDDGSPLPPLRGPIRFVQLGSDAPDFHTSPDPEGRFPVCLQPGAYRIYTEYLVNGYRVKSISAGAADLLNHPLTFTSPPPAGIVITIGR